MSALETREDLSEDQVEQSAGGRLPPERDTLRRAEDGDNVRLVPVGESIRYRKRAQSAERRTEELAGELAEARAEMAKLADELKHVQQGQELTRRLVAAGARDLDAAVLIAEARLAVGANKTDLDGVVEQLKREKQYLFIEKASAGAAVRTSPAKEHRGGAGTIERAAKRAAGTGSRADLQEYMRKRRSIV